MQLRYIAPGALLAFEVNGASFSMSQRIVEVEGRASESVVAWNVTAIWTGNNYAEVAKKLEFAVKVLNIPGGTLVWLGPQGQIVRALSSVGSIGGVRIMSIDTPQNLGAEGVNRQTMIFTAEASYPAWGLIEIVEYREDLEFGGGLPQRDVLLDINGSAPQIQTVYQRTPFTASQRGSATGLTRYPPFEPPIWPSPWTRDFGNSSGQRRGTARVNFNTRWAYSWISPTLLSATAHQPPLA